MAVTLQGLFSDDPVGIPLVGEISSQREIIGIVVSVLFIGKSLAALWLYRSGRSAPSTRWSRPWDFARQAALAGLGPGHRGLDDTAPRPGAAHSVE